MADNDAFRAALDAQTRASQSAGQAENEGHEALASGLVSMLNLLKFIPMKLNNMGEVGILPPPPPALVDKPISMGAGGAGAGAQLGFLGKAFAAILKKPDWGPIQAALQNAGVGPAENVSMASMGSFTPDFTPRNVEMGQSMGIA
ncbi:MAG: hypothetical protein K2Q01_12220 [Rickettsiales bacterium]|nr:hypothetical protein [Rickettsiales bacterium]